MTAEAEGFWRQLPLPFGVSDFIALTVIAGTLVTWASGTIPFGAPKIVVTAVLVGVGTFVLGWPRLTRRWMGVDPEGLRITTRPVPSGETRIPREDVAAFRILQRDDLGLVNDAGRLDLDDPESTWQVVLVTRDGRELPMSTPLRWADQVEQLASEVRDALGDPTIPIRRTTTTEL